MTRAKHESKIRCGGCQKEFGIIQQSHIDLCTSLKNMGILTRAQYKMVFGSTMSFDAKNVSIKTIQNFNNSLSADEKISIAKAGNKAAKAKYSDFSSRGGKVGSKVLWAKDGQREQHQERLIKLNQSGFMAQKPNKLEEKFWNLVGKEKLEFASFKFWKTIHVGKDFFNITPDFKVINQKKVIEVFGDYWHQGENQNDRISMWRSVGLECLVIWEHEINKTPDVVLTKVFQFISQNFHECVTPEVTLGGDIV